MVDVDQWDYNLYLPTQKDGQKIVITMHNQIPIEKQCQMFLFSCHPNDYHCAFNNLKAQQRSNGNTMSDMMYSYTTY